MREKSITGEGLHALIIELERTAYRLNGTNSGYLMADAASVLRKFYMAEPVADVVAWSKEGEERTCDIRWRRFDIAPGPLFTTPPLTIAPPLTPEAEAAINTLKYLHYTWAGGEHWRPPLGLPPESITGIDYKKLVEEIAYVVDGHLDYVDVLPDAIRTIIGKKISWWKIVPNFPAASWVDRYCELTNRNPDGEQTTFIRDGAVTTTFRDVAKRELTAMLSAAPLGPQPYGWIECSEELPEPNKFVQVSNGVWVGQGLYNNADHLEPDERWQDEHHEFINLLHSEPVTHWMPLPELPRKVSKNGK